MTDLKSGDLGAEAKYAVSIESGIVKVTVNYKGDGGNADLVLNIDSGYVLDEMAKKIPGVVDDAVFGLLKMALRQV